MGGETDKAAAEPAKTAHHDKAQPPPANAQTPIGRTPGWNIVAPAKLELVGDGVGRASSHDTWIFVNEQLQQGPRFRVTTSDDSISVKSAPGYVPIKGENESRANAIVLQLAPTVKGRVDATLNIEIVDAPQQLLRIPIVAWSDPGAATGPLTTTPANLSHRLDFPREIDVGEQVIGSDHFFTVASVASHEGFARITGRIQEVAQMSHKGDDVHGPLHVELPHDATDGFRSADEHDVGTYVDAKTTGLIRVRYAPSEAGPSRAMLMLSAAWSDGVVTKHVIQLRGRARGLTDVPKAGVGTRQVEPGPAPEPPNTGSPVEDFRVSEKRASDSVAAIWLAQNRGLELAHREARSYEMEPPNSPWWATLAEVAIAMGVAGIAGIVAKSLSMMIGKQITSAAQLAAGVKASDLKTVIGANDAIKEGLKAIGKKEIPLPGKPGAPERPSPKSGEEEFSSNAVIDFFSRQGSALDKQKVHNDTQVTDYQERLSRILQTSPGLAARSMWALAESLDVGRANALQEQRLATETQWVTGIANAGSSSTDRDPALEVMRAGSPHASRNGVLQIEVEVAFDESITVRGAELKGISQEIADELWGQPLVGLGIPIYVEVNAKGHRARITRDSAGVVRVEGQLPNSTENTEKQKIRGATAILDQLFAKSLKGWHVPVVRTDDASGRGDPKR